MKGLTKRGEKTMWQEVKEMTDKLFFNHSLVRLTDSSHFSKEMK